MTQAPDVLGADDATTMVWRREFEAPADELWAAITEPDGLGRWIGTWTGDPSTGSVSFTMTGEADAGSAVPDPVDVTVVACDPRHRLVVEFPETAERSWTIDLTVVPSGGDSSTLLFAQRLGGDARREDVEAGWTWYLDRLGASMRGEPMPPWTG